VLLQVGHKTMNTVELQLKNP